MALTKDEARNILSDYLTQNHPPVTDVIIWNKMSFDVGQRINETYTFKGLLCIAYDLQEKPE
jgi:hypothetical protein